MEKTHQISIKAKVATSYTIDEIKARLEEALHVFFDIEVESIEASRLNTQPQHEWQFYANGSFCRRCGTQIGSGYPCR